MPAAVAFVKRRRRRLEWGMLPAPCYVVSDLHLGFAPPEVERRFLSFLRGLRGREGSLVINGDLFEFWFEWKHVVPRHAVKTLAALAELRDGGMPVLMLAGNHDCWGGDVLRQDIGIDFRFGPWTGALAGWRSHVEHGDGLRPREDRGYRALRRVIRAPLAIRAFRLLHPDLGSRLALGSSHASRSYQPTDEGAGLREAALRIMHADPALELVVLGHSHASTLERTPGGAVYANPGSWLDAPTYLELTGSRIALRRWDGSAEGVDVHVLERRAQEALP
jgi:UDP-2,3-diacylglucosamine hydrolase